MNNAAPQVSEADRLALLASTQLLDAAPPPELEALVRLLSMQTQCATALVNLVDTHRVFSLARHGSDRKHQSRAGSSCDQVVRTRSPLLVADGQTALPPGVSVTPDQRWRSYAGVPLLVDGHAVGTLCVLDARPHAVSAATLGVLGDMALLAQSVIEAQLNAHRTRLHEARIRVASLSGSDWLWETDEDGRIQWVSASLMQHTGLDPVTEITLRARDIYQPRSDHTRASWDRYLLARERREPFSEAIAERDTPRGRIAVSISGTPVFGPQGRFMGYRGSSRNVTRQLALEDAARQQDRLLREAIEAFQAGIMITDPQGRIVQANRHWRERAGISDLSQAPSWPELVRQMIRDGRYLGATGREEDFFAWRMSIVDQDGSVPVRTPGAVSMCEDHRLPDGSIVHFSTDVSPQQRDAVTLQEVLQADLSLGLLVVEAQAPNFQAVYANSGILHMAGLPMTAPLPDTLAVLEGLGSAPEAQAHLDAALARRQTSVCVMTRQAPGQAATRAFELRFTPLLGSPLLGSPSAPGHVMVLVHDVTERQLAADKLRVSEELYRSVAATISDGLLVVGLDGSLVAMNPAGARILGLDAQQAQALCGARLLTIGLLHDDLSAPLPDSDLPWVRTARTGQRLRNVVHAVRRPDNELVWIQLSCHQLSVPHEAVPFAVVTTFRDITQERAAAQALVRSEERWKFALEGAGDAVWDWAAGQGMVYYSNRWRDMLGFDETDAPPETVRWLDLIHPDERERVAQAFEDYCHEGDGIFQAEFRVRHRLGHHLWVLARGKVVRRDVDGCPLRVVGTHSDITLLKEAERAVSDKRSAELANQAKSEFLSRMSHEIRTPLNAVRGFAQLLGKALGKSVGDTMSGEVSKYIQQILHSSQLLSDLVSDVLDLQQIEAGAIHLHDQALDLPTLVIPGVAMFDHLAERQGIALHLHQGYTGPAWGDPRRLAQVINNLVSNAIKYNQPGGRVDVRTQSGAAGQWHLQVQDTGPGMSEAQLARLFQPFERLGRDTTPIEGTGLGLIITKSLVEAMGGCLDIKSLLGEGTCVTVSLPQLPSDRGRGGAADAGLTTVGALAGHHERDAQPPPETECKAVWQISQTELAGQVPPLPSGANTPPLRVMYVEDNRINAMLFEEALRPYPQLQLEVAEDGQVALTVARAHRPEVLVIDAHLPGMTGFEVLEALRRLPDIDQVPAYMCSADAMPEDLARAQQAGFVGYWTKPIDIEAVTSELCRLAQRCRNGVVRHTNAGHVAPNNNATFGSGNSE